MAKINKNCKSRWLCKIAIRFILWNKSKMV